MPRKDFISDSLLNMSDRFKRHYDEFHNRQETGAVENGKIETDVVSEKPAEYPRLNERVEMPTVKSSFDRTEIERERRDLEGRLLRDIAFVEAEQEMILRRKDAADEFYSVLQRELENLRELEKNTSALSGSECRRRTDALRAAYFKAYGKFNAVVSVGSNAAGSVQMNSATSGENNSGSKKGAAVIVSGMIISALIIAVTLIFIFT